jgi:hypothetical protein
MDVSDHRVRYASHKRMPYPPPVPATHDDQVRGFLLCQVDYSLSAPPQVLPRNLGPRGRNPLRFGLKQSLGPPVELVLVDPG